MNTINKITEYYHNQLANMNQTDTLKLWVARDKEGALRIWKYKPIKNGSRFMEGYNMGELNREMYPEITWENSPLKVELKLIEE